MHGMNRYLAQQRMDEIGPEGQKRLRDARVLIIGCGALGSPVAMYLAGSGIGHLILADFDTVDLSNLHRQVFYGEEEIGQPKVDILKKRIETLNSEVKVEKWHNLVTARLLEMAQIKFDIAVDAADNPATTYILDDFCKRKGIPLITAGVSGWEAQVFTFIPGSFSYGDIFARPEADAEILPCSLNGILGATAAFAASLQNAETIKLLVGEGGTSSRLITANLLSGYFNLNS